MRGDGTIYLRGKIFWVSYYWQGKPYRESAKTTDATKAKKFLRRRVKAVGTSAFIEPKNQRFTTDDMLAKLKLDYDRKQNRSFKNVQFCWPHIETGFRFKRAAEIDASAIEEYQAGRRKAGALPSTINREVSYVKRAIKLLGLPVPVVDQLSEDNVRQGFIRALEFNSLIAEIPDRNVRDIIEFLYHSGWRSSEPKAMRWPWLDLDAWTVRLPAEFSKNKKPRTLPLIGSLKEIIERRVKARVLECDYVFHRNGKPIRSFRKAFKAAAKAIGLPDLVPHDMRRSAVRNFRKAGLSETDGMRLSGHRTRNVYDRYDIHDDQDTREAIEKVEKYLKAEAARKVIPIKRRA
jgi:integrase